MPLKGTKALEIWCQRVTFDYSNVNITNMTSSWRNGLGFCAIIHHHCPDLINLSRLDPEDIFGNNYLAFKVAEEQLGIPTLLDPSDMVECQTLDKLSILTYLAQYYKALHNPAALQLRLQNSVQASSLNPDMIDNTQTVGQDNTCTDKVAMTNTASDKVDVVNTATVNQKIVNTAPVNTNPDNKPVGDATAQVNQPMVITTPENQPMAITSLVNQPMVITPPDKQPMVNTSLVNQSLVITTPVNHPMVNTTPDEQPMLNIPLDNHPRVNNTPDNLPVVKTTQVNHPVVNTTPDNQPMVETAPDNPLMVKTTQVNQPMVNTIPVNQPIFNTTPDKSMLSPHPCKLGIPKTSPASKLTTASTVSRKQSDLCLVCSLPVYILERCSVRGGTLHRACARCTQCGDMLGMHGMATGYRLGRGQVWCKLCSGEEEEAKFYKNDENKVGEKKNIQEAEENLSLVNKPNVSLTSLEFRKAPPKPARTFQTKQDLPPSSTFQIGSSSSSSNTADLSSHGSKLETDVLPCREIIKKEKDFAEKILANLPRTENSFELINQELFDLDIKITGLEKQGVNMEKKIRKTIEFQDLNCDFDIVFGPRDDDLIIQLFDLVNEKNELVRKQSEVMYTKKERILEVEQAECEEQVRVLLDKSAWLKTNSDASEEERLIKKIIEIVKRRNEIVNHLEMDRIREIEEDSAFIDVKSKLSQSRDLKNIENRPRKTSARKRLLSLISRRH